LTRSRVTIGLATVIVLAMALVLPEQPNFLHLIEAVLLATCAMALIATERRQ
jgi:hypothetical protein